MTVIINIGRRLPKSWCRRLVHKTKGFVSFQENIWIMINQSLNLAKKKAVKDGRLTFIIKKDKESEDLNYEINWTTVIIRGTEEQEREEYEESLQLYKQLKNVFKKDIPQNDYMKTHFKSKILSSDKIEDAYSKGYGAMSDSNIANKLLEMGILTHVEWLKDFDSRDL